MLPSQITYYTKKSKGVESNVSFIDKSVCERFNNYKYIHEYFLLHLELIWNFFIPWAILKFLCVDCSWLECSFDFSS